LKECYKNYGLCKKCKQLNTTFCCIFRPNFKNWTSGNHDVDEFIQKAPLKAKWASEIVLNMIDLKMLNIWPWCINYWSSENNQFIRKKDVEKGHPVALKCLHNSQDITVEFLRKVKYFL
jgi:hypothetical protein